MPRPFGTDSLEVRPGGRVEIVCRRPKSWVARKPAEKGAALHPGTAVRWEDELWEVVGAADAPGGGARYEMAPWDERHAIRLLLPYDEQSEAERVADARDLRRRRLAMWAALLLAPIAGLLPGRVQESLEFELGLRATTLTLASVVAPFAVGTYAVVMTMASGFGAVMQVGGAAVAALLPLLAYFLPESFIRLAIVMGQDRPIGSLLGLPLYLLGRATGLVSAVAALPGPEPPAEERRLADRYLLLEPLLSFLPVGDQLQLRERRGFEAVTWGKRTAWFLLVYPGFTAPGQAWSLLSGSGGVPSLLLLVVALVLAVEQVRRLVALSRGEPAPSLLGLLVRPLAAPLLR